MKKIYYLILLSSFTSIAQIQIGSDIDGEAAGDESGRSLSLSSDGSTVAIGSPFKTVNGLESGHVRVFKNILGIWTQLGSDIDGESANNLTGFSVSLSSNGTIVAIGSPSNGNGNTQGYVRVYENISGVWTQIGSDINGGAQGNLSGSSLSLSSNGTIVAIGAPFNSVNGTVSGRVRVYENISGVWTQIGSDIYGEAEGDFSAHKLSLSSDGSIVAITSTANDGNGTSSGHVRVYRNVLGVWTQIGSDIDGQNAGDRSGSSVSLSSNGNIIAIGASGNDSSGFDSGHVRVFENISGVWTQIGSDINGEAVNDLSGLSVSLSSDGSIVAIGAMGNDGNGLNSGNVILYKNISGVWTQIGSSINGETVGDSSGNNVSLSSDGSIIAISAFLNDGNGSDSGHVRVYDLSALLSSSSFISDNFLIYPNPSNGIINISLENNLQLEKVNIYNQLGQLIKTIETTKINTTELAKGIYYFEVHTNEGKATKKIIIE